MSESGQRQIDIQCPGPGVQILTFCQQIIVNGNTRREMYLHLELCGEKTSQKFIHIPFKSKNLLFNIILNKKLRGSCNELQ